MNLRKLLLIPIFLLTLVVTVRAQTAQQLIKAGNELVSTGKYELAIKQYELVNSKTGNSYAQATYNIGVCYYKLFRDDDAVSYFTRALELKQGNYPKASFAVGVVLEGLGRFGEAEDAYRKSIATSHGEYGPPYFQLGVLKSNEGDLESAARFFKQASEQRGEHVPASHNNLGVMFARMGLLPDAEKEFVLALKQTDGKFDDAVNNLRLCRALQAATVQSAMSMSTLKLSLTNPLGR